MLRQELTDVLQRAQEIQDQTLRLNATNEEIELFVKAAEEAGLSRDATLQALRERVGYATQAFNVNDVVFAKSGDGAYYVARVLSQKEGLTRVRYCTGAEDSLTSFDLKPFSMTPGSKVQYLAYGCWLESDVVRVNPEGGSVTVCYWGFEEVVPFEKIRLPKDRKGSRSSSTIRAWLLWGALLTSGGFIGALIGWLVAH